MGDRVISPRAIIINGLLILGFLLWVVWGFAAAPDTGAYLREIGRHAYWAAHSEYLEDLANPFFYLAFGSVILLQILLPVARVDKVRAASRSLDFFYVFFKTPFQIFIMLPYMAYLSYLYSDVLHGPELKPIDGVPDIVMVLALFVLVDFVGWFHHLLRHKIAGIWQFHAVHHSIRHFSIFSRYRIHPIDAIFSAHIKFLPLLFFHQLFGEAAMLYLFKLAVDLFAHSNIRTNLGPLRYIFVTPQSHRIHHSFQLEHRDRNFGVTLSVWDYLFGTQYRKYDEYPEVGIEDPAYPVERVGGAGLVLPTFIGQMIYPFKVIFGGLVRRRAPPVPAAE